MSNIFANSSFRWIRVVNIDSEPAPPYALLAVVGVDDLGRVQVQRPQKDSQDGLLFNGGALIPAGLEGQAHRSFPAIVAYEDDAAGGEPANGQEWGAAADSWTLASGQSGFLIAGGAAANKVNVLPTSPTPATAAQEFDARITGQSGATAVYSFVQVEDSGAPDGWAEVSGGITGSANAEEVNGNVSVPADASGGAIVRMRPSATNGWYEFEYTVRTEIALIQSSTPDPTTGLYDAFLQIYDPTTQTCSNGAAILVRDINNQPASSGLITGTFGGSS